MTEPTAATARHVALPSFQIGAGTTGSVDCTGHAAAVVARAMTGGAVKVGGRRIRLLSNEPVPDPDSPGLNISQVADVLEDHFGLYLEQHVGRAALDFDEYEERRRNGEPALIQVGYRPIAESGFDAGRGFSGGHAMAETQHATYDPLADGRAAGVYTWTERVYPRELVREAAGELVIGRDRSDRPVKVGHGRIWCAFGRDTSPSFVAEVRPRRRRRRRHFRAFEIRNGRITGYRVLVTRGFEVPCSNPRAFRWPGNDDALRFLVRLRTDRERLDGLWIHSHWSSPA